LPVQSAHTQSAQADFTRNGNQNETINAAATNNSSIISVTVGSASGCDQREAVITSFQSK
jgi:hypothetical protein